ncbi:hypothetical protein A0H77_19550 [Vibrio alginolyticus]|uniref:hypothetical protein n=1 Tax=Vibrio alginolyticus TaxID=663 RepID=UPI000798CBEE|nr:hypothetical protein [Vibrio alginolyticus]KXZ35094.1 hypothetical protein A0H77_19550 [Vibrio alginolyticus]
MKLKAKHDCLKVLNTLDKAYEALSFSMLNDKLFEELVDTHIVQPKGRPYRHCYAQILLLRAYLKAENKHEALMCFDQEFQLLHTFCFNLQTLITYIDKRAYHVDKLIEKEQKAHNGTLERVLVRKYDFPEKFTFSGFYQYLFLHDDRQKIFAQFVAEETNKKLLSRVHDLCAIATVRFVESYGSELSTNGLNSYSKQAKAYGFGDLLNEIDEKILNVENPNFDHINVQVEPINNVVEFKRGFDSNKAFQTLKNQIEILDANFHFIYFKNKSHSDTLQKFANRKNHSEVYNTIFDQIISLPYQSFIATRFLQPDEDISEDVEVWLEDIYELLQTLKALMPAFEDYSRFITMYNESTYTWERLEKEFGFDDKSLKERSYEEKLYFVDFKDKEHWELNYSDDYESDNNIELYLFYVLVNIVNAAGLVGYKNFQLHNTKKRECFVVELPEESKNMFYDKKEKIYADLMIGEVNYQDLIDLYYIAIQN